MPEKRGFWARIMPPEHDFYALLIEQAEKILEAMQRLVEWLYTGQEEKAQRVRDLEREGDEVRSRLAGQLGQAFVTPIDREDIHHLSRRLDEVANYTRDIVGEVEMFGLQPDRYMREMAELLLEGAQELHQGFLKFAHEPAAAAVHAQNAKRLENRVEQCYRQGLKELFRGEDLKEILMRREVYRHISNTADRIDEVADALWFSVVKHH